MNKVFKAISPDYATCERCNKRFKISKKHSKVCPKCYKIVFDTVTRLNKNINELCKNPIGKLDLESKFIYVWDPLTKELTIDKTT